MRVATFNINDVNKRLPNLLDWLSEAAPDVVCLQELKAEDGRFPAAALERADYRAVWRGQRSWNGVAILARGAEPVLTRSSLPGDPGDGQSRYIEAAVRGVLIGCLYAPNGNPQPGPKFDYKLAWLDRLTAHAARLRATGLPVVLAGDYNVIPTDRDIYPSKSFARSWARNALLQPEPRARYQALLEAGWTDALPAACPPPGARSGDGSGCAGSSIAVQYPRDQTVHTCGRVPLSLTTRCRRRSRPPVPRRRLPGHRRCRI
ncbi:MAG: endonuclease/exonuclease/phosphatase family protein, partial [Proteobacteria bacterium]|nr:endonuclease/exonuclease/phosphatase family protein [Pseudomonadota bacterium]